VEGPIDKVGNTNFTFPVGKDGAYRPIAVSSLSASGTFRAEYFHSSTDGAGYNSTIMDGTLTRIQTGEYWILDRTAGTPNAIVTLSWDEFSGTVDELSSLRVARWNGTTWKDHGNGGTSGSITPGSGTISTSATVTVFSPFTLAASNANNALPVELVNFQAELLESTVLLTWQTASEIDNDYFTIEKTKDGRDFTDIGAVAGAGNSRVIQSYNFVDPSPYNGISYYRLKQTDFDGKDHYSGLVSVDNRGGSESVITQASPNPSNGSNVTISYRGLPENERIQYSLMDSKGHELISASGKTDNHGAFAFLLTTKEISHGFYIFALHSTRGKIPVKIIVN
jgi:hypothetical protein